MCHERARATNTNPSARERRRSQPEQRIVQFNQPHRDQVVRGGTNQAREQASERLGSSDRERSREICVCAREKRSNNSKKAGALRGPPERRFVLDHRHAVVKFRIFRAHRCFFCFRTRHCSFAPSLASPTPISLRYLALSPSLSREAGCFVMRSLFGAYSKRRAGSSGSAPTTPVQDRSDGATSGCDVISPSSPLAQNLVVTLPDFGGAPLVLPTLPPHVSVRELYALVRSHPALPIESDATLAFGLYLPRSGEWLSDSDTRAAVLALGSSPLVRSFVRSLIRSLVVLRRALGRLHCRLLGDCGFVCVVGMPVSTQDQTDAPARDLVR